MYSYKEIETIFSNSATVKEIRQIREAFTMLFEDKDLSNQQLFFIRKQTRARLRAFKNQ